VTTEPFTLKLKLATVGSIGCGTVTGFVTELLPLEFDAVSVTW